MRRKHWFILGVNLIVLFIIISLLYFSNNKLDAREKEIDSVQGTWHYVASFSGPLDDPYLVFNIKGDKFRITSSGKSYPRDYKFLTLYVFAPGTESTLYFEPQNTTMQVKINFDSSRTVSLMDKTFNLSEAEYQAVSPYPSGGNSTPKVEEILRLKAKASIIKIFEEHLARGQFIQEYVLERTANPSRAAYSEFFFLGPETKTSIYYAGPGEYYLVVGSYNLQNWNVQIEEYY